MRRLDVHPGFSLTLHDASEGIMTGRAGLGIVVLLAGSLRNERCSGCDAGCPIARTHGQVTLLRWQQHDRTLWETVGQPFRAVELHATPDCLAGLDALASMRGADRDHRLCRECQPGLWVGAFHTPESLARTAGGLLAAGLSSGAARLQAARGAVEILEASLEAIRRPPDCCCSARDRRRVEEARDLLEAAPAEPWCIRDLARRVGLNERKLKSGFRTQFGTTVIEHLTVIRLRVAHRALVERNTPVAQAALNVGYANASHFALLFKARYGIAPSTLLRAPT
jgi:AraC-like DNA-binding protein